MAVLVRLLGGLALLLTLGVATGADTPATSEYQLKAVFLYNFTQFVEWPADAFATPESPFGICVLGPDPFGADLDEVVRGESVDGRPIEVLRFATVAELAARGRGSCQILFVPGAAARSALAALAPRPVLTVGDVEGSALSPGLMIGFAKERQRLRLRVNGDAARAAGLAISSKLLRLGS